MPAKYDVISIGGATRDIFFRTSKARLIPEPGTRKGQLIAFEFGTKIIPEEVYLTNGGGGHNSARCFAGLGLRTAAVLSVGDDGSGHRIQNKLQKKGVDTSLMRFDGRLPTAISLIIVHGQDHISFLYRGANDHLEIRDWSLLEKTDWLYITSLTGHGASLLGRIAEFVGETGKRLAFNPGSHQLNMGYRGLSGILEVTNVLLVNHEEASSLAASIRPDVDVENRQALLKILSGMGPECVVITAGREGSCAIDPSGVHAREAAPAKVHDTTGAGDSFGATLVASIIRGYDMDSAMSFASINAASVVARLGATEGLLSLDELEKRATGYGAA